MAVEGQPSYGWQLELDKMRAEGQPLIQQSIYLTGRARALPDAYESGRDEFNGLMKAIFSIADEMGVEANTNPLAGLNSDLDRLAAHLDIMNRKYGADPQDAMDRKQALLDDAQRFLLGAQKRVLGLYEQHNVPFGVPFRQSEQEER